MENLDREPETNEAGGIYLFESKRTAEQYIEMHSKRLAEFGITTINAKNLCYQFKN